MCNSVADLEIYKGGFRLRLYKWTYMKDTHHACESMHVLGGSGGLPPRKILIRCSETAFGNNFRVKLTTYVYYSYNNHCYHVIITM